MQLLDRIRKKIQWNLPLNKQLHLAEFDDLTICEIALLRKFYKYYEVGILIEYLGHEKLKEYLPDFLDFLGDINWPAALGTARMLVGAREAIIPEIARVFDEVVDDAIWHYWILLYIVDQWEAALVKQLKPNLIKLILRADGEGAAVQALKILKEKGLLDEPEVQKYYQYLQEKFMHCPEGLKELEAEFLSK